MARRRRTQNLERVLGTPALFSTAYGNVGSSIYYALGVTAVFALGLTPLVFVIAGVIFALTAATYAEGTVRYPEAGGSSSFARHGFNEGVSFGAAWAQLLVYIATIATSAFFVPHYLSIFWEPLRTNPWDIVVGALVVVALVGLNIVGVKEAARLNIGLAVIDFATQLLLVVLGFVLVFSPEILVDNIHFGVAPHLVELRARDSGRDARLHGNRDGVEPRRGGARPGPEHSVLDSPRRDRRLRDLLHAPCDRALRAAGQAGRRGVPDAARPPARGGRLANDPVLGVVQNLGLSGGVAHALEIYVGILAATILFIATNAGVIGASRVTYAMANYRQLPDVFRRLHRRFRTPWVTLIVFAGIAPVLVLLPGQTNFLGTLYSFGATLSFTVAHASLIALRVRDRDAELLYRARPNFRARGIDWPLFALVGGLATFLSWLVVVVQNPNARWTGLGWLAAGLVAYAGLSPFLRPRGVRRDGPSSRADPRSFTGGRVSNDRRPRHPQPRDGRGARRGGAARCRAQRTIAAVAVLEVPRSLPLDAELPEEEDEADELLDSVRALLEPYGVRVVTRLARGRRAADVIVEGG